MAGAPISKAHQAQQLHNKRFHDAYFNSARREQNKAKRLARHLKRRPWDGKAYARLQAISPTVLMRCGVRLPAQAVSPVVVRAQTGVTLTKLNKARKAAARVRAVGWRGVTA